jgi:hypothetical protein
MNEPLDLVSLLIAVIALIASKEIAFLVGPYAAIVVLACSGAALSLSGNETEMNYKASIWYVMVRVLLAVVLTVSIAELLQHIVPWAKPRTTLIPLAFAIGWIKDYGTVRSFFGSVISRFASKKVGDGS